MKPILLAATITIGCSASSLRDEAPPVADAATTLHDARPDSDVGLVACGEPGTTKACKCDDGRSGEAVCRATGELGPCVCTGAPPDAGVVADTLLDASGDTEIPQADLCASRPTRLEWRPPGICFDKTLKLRCQFAVVKVFGLRCIPVESHFVGYGSVTFTTCGTTLLDLDVDPVESYARLEGEVHEAAAVDVSKGWYSPAPPDAGIICMKESGKFPFANASGKAATPGKLLMFGEVAALFAAPG